MTIDSDVRGIGETFASSEAMMEAAQAIVNAEGDILRAVQCSIPTTATREEAIRVVYRSLIHRAFDYLKANCGREFISYVGGYWAPIGVANDPHNLNENWVPNVSRLWGV